MNVTTPNSLKLKVHCKPLTRNKRMVADVIDSIAEDEVGNL